MNISKFIGCTMILIGSIIGAGILGQPLVCADAGFVWGSIAMIGLCIMGTITGLMVVEVNSAFPRHSCSFSSMAEQTLGPVGKGITWISYLLLLYSITVAYISGEASTITTALEPIIHFKIPTWINALAFTGILGISVFWSTKATDHFNRGLISAKGLLIIATLTLVMPHIDFTKLISSQGLTHSKYIWVALPVFVNAYCYQFVIPSLRIYLGDKPQQLRGIVIIGVTFTTIIYILWLAVTLGTVPLIGEHSFASMTTRSSPGELVQFIINITNNKWVATSINGFTNISMTTSFLGVTLALFDFLADGFKRPDTRFGRFQTSLLTFIPPLIIALFFPNLFVPAMNYAAIPIIIITFLLPALMVYRIRKHPTLKSSYRTKCNNLVIFLVVLCSMAFLVIAIMNNLNLLPKP